MYFLSDEERSYLSGRLLPEARQQGVHPELRGWNWQQPPLSPVYDVRLTVHEIAGKYCDSGRDVYLRRVVGVQAPASRAMREGAVLHGALAELIVRAKRTIYEHGPEDCLRRLTEIAAPSQAPLADGGSSTPPSLASPNNGGRSGGVSRADRAVLVPQPPSPNPHPLPSGLLVAERGAPAAEQAALLAKVTALTAFERQRIAARVQDVLAREPRVGADALVALALPVTVERQLNGVFLGLASHLAVDAAGTFEGLVFDVKFGRRRDFHRLTTTAYALVLESLYGCPVDVGCLVYVTFVGERVLFERDLHPIDDELRQWLIEERDERSRLVSEEIDPGKASECPETCPYWGRCRGS